MKTTDPLDLEIATSSFAALGSERRLTVWRVLVRAGPAGLSIGVLGTRSGITGSTPTHHMKILSSARLVAQSRQGRSIIWATVAYDQLHGLADFLLKACCADANDATTDHDHGRLVHRSVTRPRTVARSCSGHLSWMLYVVGAV